MKDLRDLKDLNIHHVSRDEDIRVPGVEARDASLTRSTPHWSELYRTVQLSIREQRLRSNVKQFHGGLVFNAHGLSYHSTLGWRVMKKKKRGEARNLIEEREERLDPRPQVLR